MHLCEVFQVVPTSTADWLLSFSPSCEKKAQMSKFETIEKCIETKLLIQLEQFSWRADFSPVTQQFVK